MAGLLISALGFVVLGLAVVTGQLSGASSSSNDMRTFFGYLSILFFGGASLIIARQWLGASGPVVVLTDSGITDTRIAREEIPWSSIRNLAMWQYGRQKSLVLTIDPAVEAGLTLTRMARWSRGPNRSLGVDGLCVASNGLNTSFEDLARIVTAKYQAARAQLSPTPPVDSAPH